MTSGWNILEDILKNQKPIDAQIQSAEHELAALNEKRKELQARIEQLKMQKQTIAEERLSFDRLSQSNVTNDSNEEQKIALSRSLFRGREDVYPMLVDETCWFLAVDFDKEAWSENSKAYLETCLRFNVSAELERSRSGNGGHIWIFFSEPIPARLARQLGAFMLTQAIESRPKMGFDSYDRFFPSQDTLPRRGFGNLIALLLQAKPRE